MKSWRRSYAIVGMLAASCFALLATSQPQYAADISDVVAQDVELSGAQPVATTTLRVLASAEAMGDGSAAESKLTIGAIEGADGGTAEIGPEFRVTLSWGPDDARETEVGDEAIELSLERICARNRPCDQPIEVSVEWMNAADGATQAVALSVEAGIDFRSALDTEAAPEGAQIQIETDQVLAVVEPAPTLRAATRPETITLNAQAPFALRHVTISLDSEAIPTADEGADLSAVVSIDGIEAQDVVLARVWRDPGMAGHPTAQVGTAMPFFCGESADCANGYTLVLHWTGRDPAQAVDVTWSFASVLRYPERDAPPPGDALSVDVDNVLDTPGPDGRSLSEEVSGVIERGPGAPIIQVPTEPPDAPHLAEVVLRTWDVVPTGTGTGIPSTGVVTLIAASANGDPLQGPIFVSVVTDYQAVKWGPPRNHELSPGDDRLSFAVTPSLSCYDITLTDNREDGRCTVPFDIYVQTPDPVTGPVRVEWSIRVDAFSADDLVLEPGDLAIEMGGGR